MSLVEWERDDSGGTTAEARGGRTADAAETCTKGLPGTSVRDILRPGRNLCRGRSEPRGVTTPAEAQRTSTMQHLSDCGYFVPCRDGNVPLTREEPHPSMNELSSVMHEVLKALGIEGLETVGLRRGVELGDHHHRPTAAEAGGG